VSAADLTAYLGVAVSIVALIVLPLWFRNRKKTEDVAVMGVQGLIGLNTALQTDVTRLNAELVTARQRITELEAKVQTLTEAIRGTSR
jgi:hypothetical protein